MKQNPRDILIRQAENEIITNFHDLAYKHKLTQGEILHILGKLLLNESDHAIQDEKQVGKYA